MMLKIVSKSYSPLVLKTTPTQHRKKKTLAEYRCGTGQSWGKLCVPYFLRALGFYSSVKPTFVSWQRRCFLVGKILINARIL